VGHQRPAADLPARVGAQLAIQRSDLHVERVDHRHRNGDLLARGVGQRHVHEPLAAVGGHQPPALGHAVVVEHEGVRLSV
jgi:hypothetical protein